MQEYERYTYVDVFIGIAGANHGISICPPSSVASIAPDSSFIRPCEFLSTVGGGNYHYTTLNEGEECSGNIEYYTIRGSNDKIFIFDTDSPCLDDATENVVLSEDHIGVKDSDDTIDMCIDWLNR